MKSFLSSVGHFLKKVFVAGVQLGVLAKPFIELAAPGAAPLYNVVLGQVVKIEVAAVAAGTASGTGEQKLAAVLASPDVQAAFAALEATAGVPVHTLDQQKAYVTAVVSTLNALNPPTQP